jgi:hypothetical protein
VVHRIGILALSTTDNWQLLRARNSRREAILANEDGLPNLDLLANISVRTIVEENVMAHNILVPIALIVLLVVIALLCTVVSDAAEYHKLVKYLDEHYPDWRRQYPGPS